MDFAPYQSSPPEHTRSPMSSPRASADISRRPFSPSAIASVARSPPPLQHPQPQRAWSGDLDGAASRHGALGNNGGGGLWGFGSGNSSTNNTPLAMPGAFPAEISEFDTSLGIRLDYEASLAYLAVPPIGAVILLILERNSDYVRYETLIPYTTCIIEDRQRLMRPFLSFTCIDSTLGNPLSYSQPSWSSTSSCPGPRSSAGYSSLAIWR